MTINVNEAVVKIKKAGSGKVRAVPMNGQNIHTGQYQIEIFENNEWSSVVAGVSKMVAENMISQAVNRVRCG